MNSWWGFDMEMNFNVWRLEFDWADFPRNPFVALIHTWNQPGAGLHVWAEPQWVFIRSPRRWVSPTREWMSTINPNITFVCKLGLVCTNTCASCVRVSSVGLRAALQQSRGMSHWWNAAFSDVWFKVGSPGPLPACFLHHAASMCFSWATIELWSLWIYRFLDQEREARLEC